LSDVAVIVPFRPDGASRDRHWAWLRQQWQTHYPDWPVYIGLHTEGTWIKAHATATALGGCTARILIIADADIWLDPAPGTLHRAVRDVNRSIPWVVPHREVRRLTRDATDSFMTGQRGDLAQVRGAYRGVPGGGLIVITRRNWEACGGFDPRFKGWGGEDSSFGRAADTLVGRHRRLRGILWHLWHEPQPRISRVVGSVGSKHLTDLYKRAGRSRSRMLQLVREHAPEASGRRSAVEAPRGGPPLES
jgi:hypothetical protein